MKRILFALLFISILFIEVKGQNRTILPGTKVSMVAPPGFTAADTFSGFQQVSTNSSIMVTVISGAFEKVGGGFTAENLKTVGVALQSKKDTVYQKLPAILLKGKQIAYGKTFLKDMLVFGDSAKTIIVAAVYLETSKQLSSSIASSILSVVYDDKQQSKPEDAVSFTIDTVGTGFTLQRGINSTLIYEPTDADSTSNVGFLAARSIGKASFTDQKLFVEKRLRQLPGYDQAKINITNPIALDGLQGYEILAENYISVSSKEMVYLVMLFLPENKGYFIMCGHADCDKDRYLSSFKKLTDSFQQK